MNIVAETAVCFFQLYFALWASLVFHEFGHFILAKLLKVKVKEMILGEGMLIFKFKFRKILYKIHDNPLTGYTVFWLTPKNKDKFIIVVLGGLIGDILLYFISPFHIVKMVCVFFIFTFPFGMDCHQFLERILEKIQNFNKRRK